MNNAVKVLLDRAAETNDENKALKFSQAALNAANALAREEDLQGVAHPRNNHPNQPGD